MPDPGTRLGARPALWLCAAYLAISVPLLARGWASVKPDVAALHVLLLGLVCVLAWRGGGDGAVGSAAEDLLPLILMPALYTELPALIAGLGRPLQDPMVLGWEHAVFGGQPSQDLATAYPSPVLGNVLHLAYLAYYPLIFVPPAVLYLRGRRSELRRTVFALTAVFAAGFVAFIAFPVEGPRYLWPPAPAPADEPVRGLVLRILSGGSSRGTAFPSSHMAVAVVQTMYALRFQPAMGYAALVTTIGIGAGAVYGGFHYGVDVIAGAAFGLLVSAITWRVPAGAAVSRSAAQPASAPAAAGASAIAPLQAGAPSASRDTNAS